MARTLPQTLNDGSFDYTQVRPEGQPNAEGVFDVAIYERVPPDPDHVFTPDLSYREGITDTPAMQPMDRGSWPLPTTGADAAGTISVTGATGAGGGAVLAILLLVGLLILK